MSLTAVFEGDTDLPVVKKLAADAGLDLSAPIDAGGKDVIDRELGGYNAAAKGAPWLVLRDLDHDAPCPAQFVRDVRIDWSPWMCFRLAVREVEAWLLADVDGFARFFHVEPRFLPRDPDLEAKPKRTVLDVVRRSRSRRIRDGMLPRPGYKAMVGREYEANLIEYGETVWDLDRACERSDSVARARRALRQCGERWRSLMMGG